ncbi:unnamed protein product [Trichogramma brassicae]|uniref:Uncharacterized protein n=1 Tax=Trichogramma brassicae TaxID=86971 RepID=A0A6H5IDJ6_9HYME|nr:unnamed protein product [Trichogramma brassicae]
MKPLRSRLLASGVRIIHSRLYHDSRSSSSSTRRPPTYTSSSRARVCVSRKSPHEAQVEHKYDHRLIFVPLGSSSQMMSKGPQISETEIECKRCTRCTFLPLLIMPTIM